MCLYFIYKTVNISEFISSCACTQVLLYKKMKNLLFFRLFGTCKATMSCLFSVKIADERSKQILMPWSFVEINYVSYTYSSLLTDILNGVSTSCKIETHGHCKNKVLSFATASSSFALKEEIKGDPMQDIVNKVQVFGMRYFSLFIKHDEACPTCKVSENEDEHDAPLNAFQVMMAAAANEVGKNVPKQIQSPKNGLDRLFNCILSHLSSSGCIFPKNVGPAGGTFVDTLAKLLWHLDGQYQKIEEEVPSSQTVPAIFKGKFSGYNLPEKSKHRKRVIRNLSCQKMEGLCISTKELIQCLPFLNNVPINELQCKFCSLFPWLKSTAYTYETRQRE